MAEKFGALFQLYYRPSRALSQILDSGSLMLAVAAAALVSFGAVRSLRESITPLVLLALLFVPACIAIISLWDHLGSLSVVLRRDYSPLLVCALMCWVAACLPAAIARSVVPAAAQWVAVAAILYFLVLAALAVRTVFDVHAAHPDLPIIGVGGVSTGWDAVELLLAGACAVQVGTASFVDPLASLLVLGELERWLAQRGIASLSEVIGAAH